MTALMIEKGLISLDMVVELIKNMRKYHLTHIMPVNEIGVLHCEAINELIIDEEGNVFLQIVNDDEPILLPQLANAI